MIRLGTVLPGRRRPPAAGGDAHDMPAGDTETVAARREAARLRRALDAIPQAAIVSDEAGTVVVRNAASEQGLGARHTDALVSHAVDEILAEARRGIAGTRTLDLYGPPSHMLRIVGIPLDDGGQIIGGMVIIDDVSEHRRLEAVRRDFVANVSHELRTPVGAMALLSETIASEDDPHVSRRLAGRLQAEAERMGHIIEGILDLSRLETASGLDRQPVLVHTVVDNAVDLVRPAASHHDVAIVVGEVAGDLCVVGDDRQLVSALHNLLDNAVKYSEAGAVVDISAARAGDFVEVVVADHGIGIPPGDVERIFERFYRVDRARSRATGGTGLGLAIVRHVATNHGGDVLVESREGEGSTFTLRLPANP